MAKNNQEGLGDLWDRAEQLIQPLPVFIWVEWSRRWILMFLGGFHIYCNEEQTCRAPLREEGTFSAPLHKTEPLLECSLTLAVIMQAPSGFNNLKEKNWSENFGFDKPLSVTRGWIWLKMVFHWPQSYFTHSQLNGMKMGPMLTAVTSGLLPPQNWFFHLREK